jgi:hypothetical protein
LFSFLGLFCPKHGQEIVAFSLQFASFPIALGKSVVRHLVHSMQRLSQGPSDFFGIASKVVSQHGASNGLCTTHTQLLCKNFCAKVLRNNSSVGTPV